MIPETVTALYAFLGLIAPGLVYQLLRERARPALNETAFREASRVALTSALFTTCSLLTVAGMSQFSPSWFVDAAMWLSLGTAYVVAHAALVARTVIYVVAIACTYAVITHFLVQWWPLRRTARIVRTDVWYQVLIEDVPDNHVAWIIAKLSDGTRIWGHVDFFTVGKSIEDTELSLKGPKLSIAEAGEQPKEQDYWKRVLVRAPQIALLKVAYEPTASRAGTSASEDSGQ